MPDVIQTIKNLVETAKAKSAVTLPKEYSDAYTKKVLRALRKTYIWNAHKRAVPEEFSSLKRREKLNYISNANLDTLLAATTAIIQQKLPDIGEKDMQTIIEAAQNESDTTHIFIKHTPYFEDSVYASVDNATDILRSKKLIAPAFMPDPGSEKDTMVFCSVEYSSPPLDEIKNHFLIKHPEDALLRRSVFQMPVCNKDDVQDSNILLFGGNHLEAAAALAFFQNALLNANSDETIASLKEAVSQYRNGNQEALKEKLLKTDFKESVHIDIASPKEIDLVGHQWVDENGKEHKISARAEKKAAPKKRGIGPNDRDITDKTDKGLE